MFRGRHAEIYIYIYVCAILGEYADERIFLSTIRFTNFDGQEY